MARAMFNEATTHISVSGKVMDVGAGPEPHYHSLIQTAPGTTFTAIDRQVGDQTNYEHDHLPYDTGTFDTVLSMNVLEHIYNYKFHFSELVRIIKPEGKLVLFVPFLYMYHANHKKDLLDCHRYTSDTLEKLAAENGLVDVVVTPVSRGVLTASANMLLLSMPRFLRLFIFILAYSGDAIILYFRPLQRVQFPLGYMLEARKSVSK